MDAIDEIVLKCADYYINNNSTVRHTAKQFDISKSTVHIYITERLKRLDKYRYDKVCKIINKNKEMKHIRGGLATKRKYEAIKNS